MNDGPVARLTRQWWGHTAGILSLWTRLALPWGLLAVWLSGLEWHPANGLAFMVGPVAAGIYAGMYMALRRVWRVPLQRLKLVDTLLLMGAAAAAALLLGCLQPAAVRWWLWLPAVGLAVPAWALNWRHQAAAGGPGGAAVAAAPAFTTVPVAGPVTAGYRSYDRSHTGVDIGVPIGTPVRAPAPGQVRHAGPLEQWGYAVWIDHGNGWSSFFAHLERPGVRPGEPVAAGAVIGWSGSSGISTGPHVHAELRYQGRAVDPAAMMNGAGD